MSDSTFVTIMILTCIGIFFCIMRLLLKWNISFFSKTGIWGFIIIIYAALHEITIPLRVDSVHFFFTIIVGFIGVCVLSWSFIRKKKTYIICNSSKIAQEDLNQIIVSTLNNNMNIDCVIQKRGSSYELICLITDRKSISKIKKQINLFISKHGKPDTFYFIAFIVLFSLLIYKLVNKFIL